MSPFLFTLLADGPGRLVDKAKIRGLLKGFYIGRDNIEVSIYSLRTTPYFLCILKKVFFFLQNLVRTLNIFCLSRLQINTAKSVLLGSISKKVGFRILPTLLDDLWEFGRKGTWAYP